ncbi:MAG: NUDIX domain-containing protein [Candidatus Babeliaceae bacterium]
MDIKHIKIGCEVFLIKNNELLLGKRKNCYGEGTWALPGGHLEYGESLIACAQRELKEELGIEGLEFQLISTIDNIDERGHYLHMSFLLKQFSGEIENREPHFCYEWKFFAFSNLPENIFKPHQKILKNYFRCSNCLFHYN